MAQLENIVKNLMIADNVPTERVPYVMECLRLFSNNQSIALQIQKKATNQPNPAFLPSLFNVVVNSVVMFAKSVALPPADMKYVIYGLMYQTISTISPSFFAKEMDVASFQSMYDDMYEIFLTVPSVLSKVKTTCGC